MDLRELRTLYYILGLIPMAPFFAHILIEQMANMCTKIHATKIHANCYLLASCVSANFDW